MSIYLQWKLLQRTAQKITAADLNVLHNKSGLFAIQKPYGITVHEGPKVKHSITKLFPQIEELYGLPENSLALANRLDKNVCGVLLMTYNEEMAAKIAKMYKQKLIRKKYLAILVGQSKVKSGQLTGSLKEEIVNGKYKQVIQKDGQDVHTTFKIIDHNKKSCMLCALESYTGQRHQIRAHVSQILGTPILGDHKYHDAAPSPQTLPLRLMQMLGMHGVQKESSHGKIQPWQRGLIPMHLFAQHVLIPELDDGKDVKIASPIPDYFSQSMKDCGLMFNRNEYEQKEMEKRKYKGVQRETMYVPKGIYPNNIGQRTSL